MRSLKGGNETKLSSVPVQTYAFDYGGTESENAAKMLLNMSDKQNQMNNTLSGGRRRGIKRGGSNGFTEGKIEIPQFTIPGPKVSDQNANSSSLELNSLLVKTTNDGLNDDMIGQSGGKRRRTMRRHKTRGGKRKHKRETRRKHKKSKSRRYKHRR